MFEEGSSRRELMRRMLTLGPLAALAGGLGANGLNGTKSALAQDIGDPDATVLGNLTVNNGKIWMSWLNPPPAERIAVFQQTAGAHAIAIHAAANYGLVYYAGPNIKASIAWDGPTNNGLAILSPNIFLKGNNYGSVVASGNLVLRSTPNATKGYVILADDGGKVGVGTATPGALFTVGANLFQVNSSGYALLPAGAAGSPSLSFVADTDTGLWSGGADTLNLSTGGVERVRIASDGKVGIGTTSPAYKLSIDTAIDNMVALGINISGDGGDVQKYGAIRFRWSNNAAGSEIRGYANNPAGDGSSFLTFWTTNAIGAEGERLRIDPSGNVGIGTIAPTGKLNIGYTTSAPPLSYTNGVNEGLVINATRDDAANYLGTVDFVAGRASDGSSGGAQFRFLTQPRSAGDPAVAMIVDKNGNVGIGTTGPTGKLNIGYALSTAPLSYTNGVNEGLVINATRDDAANYLGTVDFVAGRASDGPNGGSQFRFLTQPRLAANPAVAMVVDRNGSVGIGTTEPGARLVINNAGSIELRLTDTTYVGTSDLNFGGSPSAVFGSGNATARIRVQNSAPAGQATGEIQFWTSKTDILSQQMVITKDGNIGIGTVDPVEKLDVLGNISVVGSVFLTGGGVLEGPARKAYYDN